MDRAPVRHTLVLALSLLCVTLAAGSRAATLVPDPVSIQRTVDMAVVGQLTLVDAAVGPIAGTSTLAGSVGADDSVFLFQASFTPAYDLSQLRISSPSFDSLTRSITAVGFLDTSATSPTGASENAGVWSLTFGTSTSLTDPFFVAVASVAGTPVLDLLSPEAPLLFGGLSLVNGTSSVFNAQSDALTLTPEPGTGLLLAAGLLALGVRARRRAAH